MVGLVRGTVGQTIQGTEYVCLLGRYFLVLSRAIMLDFSAVQPMLIVVVMVSSIVDDAL